MGVVHRHLNISDPHITPPGKDPMDYYNRELYPIVEFLLNMEPGYLTVLTIAGDLFHNILKQDDPSAKVAIEWLHHLCQISLYKGFVVRVIQGTPTHDGKQLSMFKFLEKDYPIKLYDDITQERIAGVTYLFIPEKTWNSYDEFFETAFKYREKSDVVVFHGMVEGINPMIEKNYEQHNRRKDICIKVQDILGHIKMYCVGGHIHKRISVNPRIWYTGALSTWSMADANDFNRGYDVIEHHEDGSFNIIFKRNMECARYITIDMTNMFTRNNMNEIKGFLFLTKKDKGLNDIVRIDVDFQFLQQDKKDIFNVMKSMFASDFSFNIKNNSLVSMSSLAEVVKEYDYILDPSVDICDKIHREIKLNMKDRVIERSEIEKLVKTSLTDLMI